MSKIPTIAMIPSGYKANKVYSVLPTNGDGDLTFARTSTRTRGNEIGLVEDLATGVPALDYTDGGCPVLSLEPASTNHVTYSEDFTDTSWVKTDATITSNSETSPKGDLTADTITADAAGGQAQFVLTGTSGVDYTTSFYIKRKTGTGVVNMRSVENINTPITVTDEWTRVSLTTTSTTTTIRIGVSLDTLGDEVYIWGVQLEQQSYATSYIPTGGATATRVAETCTKGSLSSYINSNEGTLFVEIKALGDDQTERYITLNDGSNTNVVRLGFFVNNPNEILYQVNVSGTQTSQTTTSYTITDFNKIAVTWKLNEFKLFVNGVQVGSTDTSGSVPVGLDTLSFGNIVGANQPFRGKIKDLRVFNEALTDVELITLTT